MNTHDIHPAAGTWVCEHCGDTAQRGHICDQPVQLDATGSEATC